MQYCELKFKKPIINQRMYVYVYKYMTIPLCSTWLRQDFSVAFCFCFIVLVNVINLVYKLNMYMKHFELHVSHWRK